MSQRRRKKPGAAGLRECLESLSGVPPREIAAGITLFGTVSHRGIPYAVWSRSGDSEARVSVLAGKPPYRFRVGRTWIPIGEAKRGAGT